MSAELLRSFQTQAVAALRPGTCPALANGNAGTLANAGAQRINLPSEFFTNLNSESSFVLEPGCGESISVESEVIGAKLKKLEKRKVGKTSQISSGSAEMDSPALLSNTKVQSEFS